MPTPSNTLHGHILTPTGFVHGTLTLDAQGRIAGITGTPVATAAVRDSGVPIVLPGFIDLHVHGGAGHDIMEGGDAALHVATLHARHGTTSLLATTMTAPQADLDAAFAAMGPLCAQRAPNAARVLGVHLEGPYISEARLGAQPPFARPASLGEIHRLHAMAPIRLITLAPEVGGNHDLIAQLVAEGFKVQLGHTTGSYEQGVAALRCGATGFTHLFNAMSALHHREPGMVGAALAHAEFAEVIPDLLHVHPGAIHTALRAIPKLYCVTDSTSAAGMPDGDYKLGRHTVTKCMGGVRLADGTLAGSVLSMDQALRNLVDTLGLDLADASKRVSTYAADHLGLPDRGRLQAGAWGDVVVLDRDLALQAVRVEGQEVLLN
ncbi:MAG: N-acetylglucosamine-6-phosphate deacetylase [Curvibacter sp. RIFCSPHIGHO2_12_FULL_63_18]|uniref:N-acetylglucosamine-6-phosphate deacetylase n=1 Tax=Rhodoferax sp. TaxID=50421 RepID=UPI0008C44FDC|nr:N-acetylglucosamine-6-phosphate deacetylase [Rhodoferax sp.]OGO94759.1 MAG: N-acetylglucosamine-6-phosphate deacetylase [Curvibacter sp. GWA2_63_95]OGP06841.1 MAG: N-acetylglucosamine-6-phosphate deacetylase [Curvibacter sp. RIFCSPHIGHO2_12_FULL_63_18]HCX80259.1 N-acetylglucosamine-6-phosphate deacetylase [Rhodoferax sp.]